MKDARNQAASASDSAAARGGPAPAPGKRTLTEGLTSGAADGALLDASAIERARRSNPIYHAQLKYDPAAFGAGNDVSTEPFALAVAKYQKAHTLVVDGM